MIEENIVYEADGLSMQGRLYYMTDDAVKRPGILVFPEAFGLGAHVHSRAERLARLGYVALACDLHGNALHDPRLSEVIPLIQPMREDPSRLRARAQGAYDALLDTGRVDREKLAAIGFCFGGTMALELARSGAELAGIVGFHCSLTTKSPEDAKNIKGKVLVCIGADDPGITPDDRLAFEEEMRAATVNWQLSLYGGTVHGFTNPEVDAKGMPERLRYDPQADHRSWTEMRTLFEEVLGTPLIDI
jgi:dienelactone hydrolase